MKNEIKKIKNAEIERIFKNINGADVELTDDEYLQEIKARESNAANTGKQLILSEIMRLKLEITTDKLCQAITTPQGKKWLTEQMQKIADKEAELSGAKEE